MRWVRRFEEVYAVLAVVVHQQPTPSQLLAKLPPKMTPPQKRQQPKENNG
jgi:hypothetical protein